MADQFTINGKLSFDVSDAGKQMDSLKNKMKDVGKTGKDAANEITAEWAKTGKTLSNIGKNLTKAVTLPILAAATAAVKLSSDLTETMGKASVVFGDNFGAIEAWSNGAIENMGLAKESALDAASTFGDLATSMGIGQTTAADMSMDLTQLAADMASFKNISVERAQVALNGIFTGETESLKGLGIVMNETTLEQFAMNQGLNKTYKEMSQTEKVMLRYKFVMSSTKNAQGDFARTSDSVANQTRAMGERLKEVGANFGDVLAPMVGKALAAVNDFLSGIMSMDAEQRNTIVTIGLVVAAIPILISVVGGAITAFLSFQAAITTAGLAMGNVVAIIGLVVAAAALLVGTLMAGQQEAEYSGTAFDEFTKSLLETGDAAEEAAGDVSTAAGDINKSLDGIDKSVDIDVDLQNNVTPEKITVITGEIEDGFGDKEVYFSIDAKFADEYKTHHAEILSENKKLGEDINTLVDVDKKKEYQQKYAKIEEELEKIAIDKIVGVDIKKVENYETQLTTIETELAALKEDVEIQLVKEQESWTALQTQITEWKEANNVEVAVSVSGDTEVINAMAAALGGVVTAADDMPAAIEKSNAALDSSLTKLREVAFESLATQLIYVASMVQTGQVSEAEGLRMTGQLISSFQAYDSQISMTTEQQKAFVTALTEGATPAEAMALAMGIVATGAVTMDTSISSATEGMARLDELNGQVGTSADLYNTVAGQTATLLDGEVSAALETASAAEATHATAISEATSTYDAEKTALDASLLAYQSMPQALFDYSVALAEGKTESEALALVEQKYSTETAALLKKDWADRIVAGETTANELFSMISDAHSNAKKAEEDQSTALKAIEDKKIQDIQAADETFYTTMAGLQTSFNTETLLAAEASMEAQGYVWDEGQKAKYLILVNSIAEIGAAATDGGKTIGAYMTEGEIAGMESKSGQLYTTARRIIAKAIQAMQNEADSHSPSRKTEKLVGKPLADGIGVGFENNLKPLIAKVKAGTSNIIGGAAKAVNEKPNDIRISADRAKVGSKAASNIVQNNNFTARTLTPYEQRIQLKKLDNDLAEVFA